jgi:hypothetical protein
LNSAGIPASSPLSSSLRMPKQVTMAPADGLFLVKELPYCGLVVIVINFSPICNVRRQCLDLCRRKQSIPTAHMAKSVFAPHICCKDSFVNMYIFSDS